MHKKTLLFKNAELLVTMDDERREIRGGCLLVEGNRIVAVGGKSCALPLLMKKLISMGTS